jgi:hypothetical protein
MLSLTSHGQFHQSDRSIARLQLARLHMSRLNLARRVLDIDAMITSLEYLSPRARRLSSEQLVIALSAAACVGAWTRVHQLGRILRSRKDTTDDADVTDTDGNISESVVDVDAETDTDQPPLTEDVKHEDYTDMPATMIDTGRGRARINRHASETVFKVCIYSCVLLIGC